MTQPGAETGPEGEARLAWLRLARTPGIGPISFARLIERFGDATGALDALPELARRAGGRPPAPPAREQVEAEMEAIERFGARLLTSADPEFPDLLRELDPPPPVITVKGRLEKPDNDRPVCALVGARNASAAGLRFARQLGAELGQAGALIVSGLARGVDGAAHAGALDTGTIAVLAGGVDHVYPPEHGALYEAISERGLIVSERGFGRRPVAKDFPRRNRLISGLAHGVLVVEAAVRSGSLITARLAAEQGREVMAVPGSPLDPRAAGGNRLIREGAALIESAADVMAVLQGARPAELRAPPTSRSVSSAAAPPRDEDPPSGAHDRLAALLCPTPVSVDELARQSGLSSGAALAALTELELAGRARQLPGGLVQSAGPQSR